MKGDDIAMTGRGHKIPLQERFWAKVDKRDPAECWLWTGVKTIYGYGQIRIGYAPIRYQLAHRVSYAIHNGVELQSSDVIMHACDNPICVNPLHLSCGTHADNVADMVAKGRQRTGSNKGETNGRALMTADQVRQIRASKASHSQAAKIYGVSKPTVAAIRSRRLWSHIP